MGCGQPASAQDIRMLASESPPGGADKWITSQPRLRSRKWGVRTGLAVCSTPLAGQVAETKACDARPFLGHVQGKRHGQYL